jgi:hypothetical protein
MGQSGTAAFERALVCGPVCCRHVCKRLTVRLRAGVLGGQNRQRVDPPRHQLRCGASWCLEQAQGAAGHRNPAQGRPHASSNSLAIPFCRRLRFFGTAHRVCCFECLFTMVDLFTGLHVEPAAAAAAALGLWQLRRPAEHVFFGRGRSSSNTNPGLYHQVLQFQRKMFKWFARCNTDAAF